MIQARRRGRISDEQVGNVLTSFEGLGIALRPVTWRQMLLLALRFDRSAYDAAYLALAEMIERPLIIGDRRVYNAVQVLLDGVQWTGDHTRD